MSETTYASPAEAVAANPPPASADTNIVEYVGAAVPDTVTINQAADDLTAYRGANADSRALSISSEFAAAIDAMRASGVTIGETPNAPTAQEATAQWAAAQPAPVESATDADLDPERTRALALPAIREAICTALSEATATREAYAGALVTAQRLAQASLLVVAPELQGLPIEQFQQALGVLQNVNPGRYLQVVNALDIAGQITAAQQHEQAQNQVARATWVKSEEARYRQMVGPVANAEQFGPELEAYSAELGIPRDQLIHLLQTEPVLQSAAFQKVIHDQVQSRIAQKRATAALRNPTRPVPPVVRPGVSVGRSERSAADLAGLNSQLSKTGSLADAFQLLKAKRK